MKSASEVFAAVTSRPLPAYGAAMLDPDRLFQRFLVNTPLRLAHFLAQVLHESGGGRISFENLSYTTPARLLEIFGVGRHSAAIRPEEVSGLLRNPPALAERVYGLGNPPKARELGNAKAGEAFRYRGGGLMQTTGGGAYRRISRLTGVDFAGDPDLIVTADHALKPALFEWDEKSCNALADKNDIRTITRRINGGYNGLKDRQAWFDKVWGLVGAKEAWRAGSADPDTVWLQEALNQLGAQPVLVVDGRYGPGTTAAVRAFQKLARLKVDGIAGEVTRAAIRLRLDVVR